jgi:hypothetical protein
VAGVISQFSDNTITLTDLKIMSRGEVKRRYFSFIAHFKEKKHKLNQFKLSLLSYQINSQIKEKKFKEIMIIVSLARLSPLFSLFNFYSLK